jgi:hypothetical protein
MFFLLFEVKKAKLFMKHSKLILGLTSFCLAIAAVAATKAKRYTVTSGYITGANLHCTLIKSTDCTTSGTIQCTSVGHTDLWALNNSGRCTTKVFKVE